MARGIVSGYFGKQPPELVYRLLGECAGHPRSIEAVCVQWKKGNFTPSLETLPAYREAVLDHHTLALPKILEEHVLAALSGRPMDLDNEIPGTNETFENLIKRSVFLNGLGPEDRQIPQMSPLLLHRFLKVARPQIVDPLRRLLHAVDQERLDSEKFHRAFEELQDLSGRVPRFHLSLPQFAALQDKPGRGFPVVETNYPLKSTELGSARRVNKTVALDEAISPESFVKVSELKDNFVSFPSANNNKGFDFLEVVEYKGASYVLLKELKHLDRASVPKPALLRKLLLGLSQFGFVRRKPKSKEEEISELDKWEVTSPENRVTKQLGLQLNRFCFVFLCNAIPQLVEKGPDASLSLDQLDPKLAEFLGAEPLVYRLDMPELQELYTPTLAQFAAWNWEQRGERRNRRLPQEQPPIEEPQQGANKT